MICSALACRLDSRHTSARALRSVELPHATCLHVVRHQAGLRTRMNIFTAGSWMRSLGFCGRAAEGTKKRTRSSAWLIALSAFFSLRRRTMLANSWLLAAQSAAGLCMRCDGVRGLWHVALHPLSGGLLPSHVASVRRT